MTKEEILFEIKRIAKENEGKSLGVEKFEKLSGILRHTWRGKYWKKWSDALAEAGIEKNKFGTDAYEIDFLIKNLISLTRKLGHFPTQSDMLMEKHNNKSFPSAVTIRKRLGTACQRIQLIKNCISKNSEYSDVYLLLPKIPTEDEISFAPSEEKNDGFVYMVKEQFSKQYKIGKTFDVPRRHREITLELPGDLKKIHSIRTDDPSGIEAYWHKRFENKRTNGEWFALTPDDIRVFKRRKFM